MQMYLPLLFDKLLLIRFLWKSKKYQEFWQLWIFLHNIFFFFQEYRTIRKSILQTVGNSIVLYAIFARDRWMRSWEIMETYVNMSLSIYVNKWKRHATNSPMTKSSVKFTLLYIHNFFTIVKVISKSEHLAFFSFHFTFFKLTKGKIEKRQKILARQRSSVIKRDIQSLTLQVNLV